MSLIGRVNRLLESYVDTVREAGCLRVWVLLLSYGAVHAAILWSLGSYPTTVGYALVHAWLQLFRPEISNGFSHYPGHLLLLPYVFDWSRFAVGLLLEGGIMGGVAMAFYDRFVESRQDERLSWRLLWSSWGNLIAGWLVVNGLMLAAAALLPGWLETWLHGSPRRQLLVQFGVLPGFYVFVMAVFFFVIPIIAIYGENVFQAVSRSVGLFARHPFGCFLMAGSVLVLPLSILTVAGRSDIIVERFHPELIRYLLFAGIVAETAAGFLWMGLAVRFMLEEEP